LLDFEIQRLVKITGERRESCVVGKPLEKLADIGDPERTLETRANFMQAFGKVQ